MLLRHHFFVANSKGLRQQGSLAAHEKIAFESSICSMRLSSGNDLTVLGRFGAEDGPVGTQMLFCSGERLLGTQNVLLLAALGLVPQIAPLALDFLHLWRAR